MGWPRKECIVETNDTDPVIPPTPEDEEATKRLQDWRSQAAVCRWPETLCAAIDVGSHEAHYQLATRWNSYFGFDYVQPTLGGAWVLLYGGPGFEYAVEVRVADIGMVTQTKP